MGIGDCVFTISLSICALVGFFSMNSEVGRVLKILRGPDLWILSSYISCPLCQFCIFLESLGMQFSLSSVSLSVAVAEEGAEILINVFVCLYCF